MTETAAYPSELEADIVLANRCRVRIRPLRRCEEESLRELYEMRRLLTGLGEIVSTKMSGGTSEFAFVRCRTK